MKHGRGKNTEITFVDSTPPEDLVEKAQLEKWKSPRRQKRYFLNTMWEDIAGTQVRRQYIRADRSIPRMHNIPQLYELSNADGFVFQYFKWPQYSIAAGIGTIRGKRNPTIKMFQGVRPMYKIERDNSDN